jgi:hypothetical protein
MKSKLGWLGPAIVIVGAAVAALGVWYMVHARPEAGDVVDEVAMDGASRVVIRNEAGDGVRAFVEVWDGDELRWQALVPHYVGSAKRHSVAWSSTAITVRVERGGRAEVFALSAKNAAKLGGFRLAVAHEPIVTPASGPITVSDRERSYEFVGGASWHEVVAIDLTNGRALWKFDLGAAEVTDARVAGGVLQIRQSDGVRRALSVDRGQLVPGANEFRF